MQNRRPFAPVYVCTHIQCTFSAEINILEGKNILVVKLHFCTTTQCYALAVTDLADCSTRVLKPEAVAWGLDPPVRFRKIKAAIDLLVPQDRS